MKTTIKEYNNRFNKPLANAGITDKEFRERKAQPDYQSYYQSQLNRLDIKHDTAPSIVVYDGDGNQTKTMTLNDDSIKALSEFMVKFNKGGDNE